MLKDVRPSVTRSQPATPTWNHARVRLRHLSVQRVHLLHLVVTDAAKAELEERFEPTPAPGATAAPVAVVAGIPVPGPDVEVGTG